MLRWYAFLYVFIEQNIFLLTIHFCTHKIEFRVWVFISIKARFILFSISKVFLSFFPRFRFKLFHANFLWNFLRRILLVVTSNLILFILTVVIFYARHGVCYARVSWRYPAHNTIEPWMSYDLSVRWNSFIL